MSGPANVIVETADGLRFKLNDKQVDEWIKAHPGGSLVAAKQTETTETTETTSAAAPTDDASSTTQDTSSTTEGKSSPEAPATGAKGGK